MSATIAITDTITGETRLYTDEYYGPDVEVSNFLWSDGNYACDCNRRLFFFAFCEEDKEDDIKCGDDRYVISSIFYEGRFTYSEI